MNQDLGLLIYGHLIYVKVALQFTWKDWNVPKAGINIYLVKNGFSPTSNILQILERLHSQCKNSQHILDEYFDM